MTKTQPLTRHIISINDLTNKEIETIFEVAQGFLKELADENVSYRIGRSTDLASKFILASLFYEPSTRTRLSFESAMLRLGGSNITSADPAVSSAAKGESLADTIRVIANYADVVVIRHPRDGAVRLAAEYSQIPVINGGDGSHEHPTQTLCDLFTLRSKNRNLRNMKIAISGDLKGSRTIHSFVYALARFGATIDPLPAPGMELPAHVDRRLREEFHSHMVSKDSSQPRRGRRTLCHRQSAAPAFALCRAGGRLRAGRREKDRRGLCHPLPERTLGRQGSSLSKSRRDLSRRRQIFRGERHAPAAPRQRARRLDRYRPPRDLFSAGRLRRSGAHGADLASSSFAQEQFAAPLRRRFRQTRISDVCAADRHRHRLRQYQLHHLRARRTPICRPQILRHPWQCAAIASGCAASIARATSTKTRRTNSSSPTRRGRLFGPAPQCSPMRPTDRLKSLIIYRSEADAVAAGFAPRETGGKARAV